MMDDGDGERGPVSGWRSLRQSLTIVFGAEHPETLTARGNLAL